MSMPNIPINRIHFIVCIKRVNRKNRHNLYDTNLLVSIRNLKKTVTYNRDNSLICTTNYPVKISALGGIKVGRGRMWNESTSPRSPILRVGSLTKLF